MRVNCKPSIVELWPDPLLTSGNRDSGKRLGYPVLFKRLHQIVHSTQTKRLHERLSLLDGGHHHDPSARIGSPYVTQRVNTALERHDEIHGNQVRLQFSMLDTRLFAILSLAHHFMAKFLEDALDHETHESRVVHYQYAQTHDGLEALDALAKSKPDLMLVDWNMPRMDGITLVRKVRETNKSLPIIMCTTEAEKTRVVEALKAGVNDYIVKPFTPERLSEKIQRTVAKIA